MEKYLLTILGSSVDYFYEADEYPLEGDFSHARYMGMSTGGCPLNVAMVAASKNANVKALDMLGKDDTTTEFILSECKKHNVDTKYIQIKKDVTNGKVVIINTGDNRTMFVIDPIRPYYEIDNNIQNLLNNSSYIYSLLHMINRSFETIKPLLQAKEKGAKVIIDGSSKYDDPDRVKMLYSLVDGLFINEINYERLKSVSDKDPKEIIFAKGGEFVCITNGSKGSTLYTKDNSYYEPSLQNINVIDSTGAGDSFAGGFISSLLNGYDYQKALKIATANGAYACTIFSGQGGVCTIDELRKFSKEHDYEI